MSGLANILQGKDAEFSLYVTDSNGHPIDLTGWTMIRARMPQTTGYLEKFAPPIIPVDAVQSISFGATPTAGSFALKPEDGDFATSLIPFNANAAAVQSSLRALAGLGDVTVSGSVGAGFSISFAGGAGGRRQPLLTVVSNTLVATATPVVVTVVTATSGIPESGISVINATQGAVKVILSEDDTVLLKVGVKLDMDLSVRIGPKDLNIPTIKAVLNIVKNPFA